MFKPDENRSTEDGIRIEPASNNKISMRSPSSNAIIKDFYSAFIALYKFDLKL